MSSNSLQPSSVSPQDMAAGMETSYNIDASGPTRNEWLISGALFLLTLLSTSYAGMMYGIPDIDFFHSIWVFLHKPGIILYGFSFSIPLMSILLAHEAGHFIACRYYRMRCTPPFFIPMPLPPAGTLGAFIKIKSPFPNKRALLDIGIAGPLAGFALVLPFLCLGIKLSRLLPQGMVLPAGEPNFGEPLIFRLLGGLLLGYSSDDQIMIAHPIAMAAWVGLLVTSLNLLPIWQLDGGHIAYALLGRFRQKRLSIIAIAFLILISFLGWPMPSYLIFAALLLFISARTRFYHPPTQFEDEPVGSVRIFLGLLALLLLVISFIPVPISFS